MHDMQTQANLKKCLGDYFSDEEIEILTKHGVFHAFVAGNVITQQGKEASGIYIIIKGNVVTTAKILGAGTANLETLLPGNFLGEASFIEKDVCSTSSITVDEVQCLLIDKFNMKLLALYYPEIKFKLFRIINSQVCKRLKKMHDKVISHIAESDIVASSFFTDLIQSVFRPTKITSEVPAKDKEDLKKIPIFAHFNQEEISELLERATLISAPKNYILINKSKCSASCYVVIQGAVQSSIVESNKLCKLSVIGPNKLFVSASVACKDNISPFTITFSTREKSVLLRLVESDLLYLENTFPQLWYKLFGYISHSLIALEKSVDKLDVRLHIENYNR